MSLYPEPPTGSSLCSVRNTLRDDLRAIGLLDTKIADAENSLSRIVADAQAAIDQLMSTKAQLEEQVARNRSYLAPIRLCPNEILREIFYYCFALHPCTAWVLAAVSRRWRDLALEMPRIWSKIRLLTTQHASADTIRLWLERSGPSVPLDIEIFLHVANSSSDASTTERHRRRSLSPPPSSLLHTSPWAHSHNGTTMLPVPTHYIVPTTSVSIPPASNPSMFMPMNPPSLHTPDSWMSSPASYKERSTSRRSTNASNHWGYIAIFYLVEQMHRWERFVFRFDKQFSSISALTSIVGDAPLLKEFEISSGEAAYYPDWLWLPNLSPSNNAPSIHQLPKLESLTLQFMPFKWSSPMLHTSLHTLTLRALPGLQMPLDRIAHILHANKNTLRYLSLHVNSVTPHILPLSPLVLPELLELSIAGHGLLTSLIDTLTLPSLEELNLDIECRDSVEEVIHNLVSRSGSASGLKHLGVAYGFGCGRRASKVQEASLTMASSRGSSTVGSGGGGGGGPLYYGPSSVIMSWNILMEIPNLESLRVGGAPMEGILGLLGLPDEDFLSHFGPPGLQAAPTSVAWICPNLTELGLKNCHGHTEAVSKLVQMISARNPDSAPVAINGITPKRFISLDIHDCGTNSLAQDIISWLDGRVPKVVVTETVAERSLGRFFVV